ncbi:MAG: hypothetical protein KDA43_11485, partial [Hyphomonas sp.]|nr:hypothetical protein [Hyphomonas sp.]
MTGVGIGSVVLLGFAAGAQVVAQHGQAIIQPVVCGQQFRQQPHDQEKESKAYEGAERFDQSAKDMPGEYAAKPPQQGQHGHGGKQQAEHHPGLAHDAKAQRLVLIEYVPHGNGPFACFIGWRRRDRKSGLPSAGFEPSQLFFNLEFLSLEILEAEC